MKEQQSLRNLCSIESNQIYGGLSPLPSYNCIFRDASPYNNNNPLYPQFQKEHLDQTSSKQQSILSLSNLKDSMFQSDPKLRTRRSKLCYQISALSIPDQQSPPNKSQQRKIEIIQPQTSQNYLRDQFIDSLLQQNYKHQGPDQEFQSQIQIQAQSASTIPIHQGNSLLPLDLIQRAMNMERVSYNLNDLNSHPATRCSSEYIGSGGTQVNNHNNQNDTYADPLPSPIASTTQGNKQSSKPGNIDFDEIDDDLLQRKALLRLEHRRIQDKRKRQKKSDEELQILEIEFSKGATWEYQKKVDLAIRLGMTFSQVSKWNWDRKKKEVGGVTEEVVKKKTGPAKKGGK